MPTALSPLLDLSPEGREQLSAPGGTGARRPECLIIEDDAHNARLIREGLGALGYIATVCDDGVQGLTRALAQPWDLIILDRMLPGEFDGLAIARSLRERGVRTPILGLSALSAIDERVRGLQAGCDDYLTKPFAFPELAARVLALLRRAPAAEPARVLQLADLRLDLLSRIAERAGEPLALQPREFRLLAFLMVHAHQVVTRQMLLESVWDFRFDPQTNLVDVHISRLRNKVDRSHERALIRTVRGAGYTISDRP